MNIHHNTTNTTIKVLVLVGSEPLAEKITFSDGSVQYRGLYYDMWSVMKKSLTTKYQFEEEFQVNSDYNQIIDSINKGTYDICIAPFTPNFERVDKVNFTNSIISDSPSILHFKRLNYFNTIYELIKEVFILPLLIIILLGLIIGTLFYYVEKDGWNALGIKKAHYFRKAFLTIVSSFFGESGFLTGTNTLHIYNIMVIIFILMLSTIITMYVQANATSKMIELNSQGYYNRQTIKGKHFITQTGYDDGRQVEQWGGKVTYVDKPVDIIVKEFIENPSKYNGVVLDRTESYYYVDLYKYTHPDLTISYSDFGYIDQCFPINKNRVDFLTDVDLQIMNIQTYGFTEKICREYRDQSLVNLCVH
uniref:Solute-binding protein family 3/N-terminal domain-containing protein n=1 Tax=viral metagenome TaxID=1070528 RepID=A0A6C0HH95_9ZZZZ